jgi:hypothetical protein
MVYHPPPTPPAVQVKVCARAQEMGITRNKMMDDRIRILFIVSSLNGP